MRRRVQICYTLFSRFQSTHPVRGATNSHGTTQRLNGISIHAPRAGCDYSRPPRDDYSITISIHAPRAGCDATKSLVIVVACISIHAPRAGCDKGKKNHEKTSRISIHAPRAGCDHESDTPDTFDVISIHAPRAGCDQQFVVNVRFLECISIHAPRAGCDNRERVDKRLHDNFNPRTPCGVRLMNYIFKTMATIFQSTHPVRGATPGRPTHHQPNRYFNPRTPCGVRPA